MDISLVVCTRNRAAQLADALPYFARLRTGVSWEIVFVYTGSGDATPEMLAAFIGSSGLNARMTEEPRFGLSVARNTGWRQASGKLVVFTDDDCYPAPDYLDRISRCFSETDLGYLGGRVLRFDRNDYEITVQESEHRLDIPPRSFVPPGLVHGANMTVRRDVLERLCGFDERLGAGTKLCSGEDVDILGRASALGLRGAYDPRPLVYHHHRRSKPEELMRLMECYDIGRGAYYAKALMDRRMRWNYLWPVLRKIGGNIWRGEYAVMQREFHGAWKYIVG
jgi:hypothetical protein